MKLKTKKNKESSRGLLTLWAVTMRLRRRCSGMWMMMHYTTTPATNATPTSSRHMCHMCGLRCRDGGPDGGGPRRRANADHESHRTQPAPRCMP